MTDSFSQKNDLKKSTSKRWNTYSEQTLPLWVADMDFPLATEISQSLHEYINQYPLVYPIISERENEIICNYLASRYNWEVLPEWVVWLSGVVPGIHVSVQSFEAHKKQIIIPTPVYPPFFRIAPRENLILAELTKSTNKWHWQMPLATGKETMIVICHPHNPTGKVFRRAELETISDYCAANDLLVCSDEIYADLVLEESTHIPIALINEDMEQRTITLMSAGKTWNISGTNSAFAIIANKAIRDQFKKTLPQIDPGPNTLGIISTCAALTKGENWRKQLLAQLRTNRARIEEAVAELPGVDWLPNQATFLAWLQCHNHSCEQAFNQLLDVGLAVSSGDPFGATNHIRLNYGCTEENLEKAICCLQKVFS